ncbi:MAG: BACON domain-containing carbohydrate-binding protein, partial [Rikenellaceae bacterium]
MNKIKITMQSMLWLCVTCFSLLVGCVHEDLSAVASVDERIVTVDASVNNYSYTITSNSDWSLVSNDTWCTPSKESGSGTTKINLYITANPNAESRTAVLTLTCGGTDTSISVIQAGLTTSLAVSPELLTVDSNSNDVAIAVMSNTSWSATTTSDWVTFNNSTESGSNNSMIYLTCAANDTYAEREAVILIYVGGSETMAKSVTITQLSQGMPSLTLGAESVTFTKDADSHTISYVSNITSLSFTSEFDWCTVVDNQNGTVTISVAQNSTTSSRSAVVTATGVVDGEATTAQILVSQAGTGSPSINLINNALTFSAAAKTASTSATLSWVAENGTTVSKGFCDSWINCLVSTASATVSMDSDNTSADARVGTIELVASNGGETTYYYVTVTQEGTGSVSVSSSPTSIALSSQEESGSVYYVSTGNVTFTGAKSSNTWLTIDPFDASGVVSYSATANISDAMRNATITLTYTANGVESLYSIPVSQNGLGSPSISTLDNVYMQTYAETFELEVWMESIDETNVSLEVVSVSYTVADASSSLSTREWLTAIVNSSDSSVIDLTTIDNTADESRTATVTFKVTRDNSTAYKTITVTQAGHLSAGISGLTQEIYIDHEGIVSGDGDSKYGFVALNGSTVEVMTYPSWMTADVNNTTAVLMITAEPYSGGETGSYREGYITLVVSNGNDNSVYYDILVRQYEPEAAMIEGASEITLGHDAYTDVDLDFTLLNGSEIESVTITAVDAGATTSEWLTTSWTSSSSEVKFSADKFTGPEDSRQAVIAITVSNSHANKYVHYVTVTQVLAEATTITATESTTVSYDDTSAKLTYSTTGSGYVTVTASTDASWVTAINTVNGVATITLEDNQTLEERSAEIQLVAKSADNVTTATTYATLIQGAAPETTLEVAEAITAIAAGETITIIYSADGYSDVTVTATSGASWISNITPSTSAAEITLKVAENVESDERTATVEVTAKSATTGSAVVKNVTVTQAGSGDAVMSVAPSVSFDYEGLSTATITPTFMEGATLVSVSSSEDWVVIDSSFTEGDSTFDYEVLPYDGSDGETRIATITVKAVSKAGVYTTCNVTVAQTAPKAISLTAASVVTTDYTAKNDVQVVISASGDAG